MAQIIGALALEDEIRPEAARGRCGAAGAWACAS